MDRKSIFLYIIFSIACTATAHANGASHYCYKAELAGDTGSPKIGQGMFVAEVTVTKEGRERTLEFSDTMPDSGQVVDFETPLPLQSHDGAFSFSFKDDAWGIWGKGTLHLSGDTATIRFHDLDTHGVSVNALRNYGDTTLTKATCLANPKLFGAS